MPKQQLPSFLWPLGGQTLNVKKRRGRWNVTESHNYVTLVMQPLFLSCNLFLSLLKRITIESLKTKGDNHSPHFSFHLKHHHLISPIFQQINFLRVDHGNSQ